MRQVGKRRSAKDGRARKEVRYHLQIIHTWAAVYKKYGGIRPECCEDIEKWAMDAIEMLDSLYSPQEVREAMLETGHHELQFRLGDFIRYSPSEVQEILEDYRR